MRIRSLRIISWTLLASSFPLFVSCGGGSGGGSAPTPAPTISSFVATPSAIPAGQSSTLSWSVSGASSLAIDQGVGAVTGTSKAVSPAATTTYTFTASNAAGSATATTTVTVVPAPVISSFTATPATVASSEPSTICWTVTGATGLSIDQGVGPVTGTCKSVNPSATTTYTLTASNTQGGVTATATRSVTVTVPAPAVFNFGEAPDGTATGYPNVFGIINPAQIGGFPTLLAHNGARTQSTADGTLGTLASLTADAVLGDFTDEDGLQNMIVVLTSIPPPAAITVRVTAPAGSSGGTMYLNAVFDKNMNGAWDGASEWVVQNQPVSLPAAGTSTTFSPPAFAFSNGNILPDPAWMRIALTRDPIASGAWDGSGSLSSGEVEDYLVHLPALPGPPIKKVPILTVQPGGPYTFPGGVGILPTQFVVSNWAPTAGTFTYSFNKLDGNVALLLPWAPPPAPPVPIGAFDPVAGTPATVAVAGTASSPNQAALPSHWRVDVDPVDPPAFFVPGGVYIGEGMATGILDFAGTPAIISHTFSTVSEVLSHQIGVSPCPTPFSPIIITNTGNVPLQWTTSNPMAFVTLDQSGGTIPVGGTSTINPSFPCSGYVVGMNTGTLGFTIQQSGTGTASTGPSSVGFSLTVY